MRTACLSLLLLTLPACSDDGGDDDVNAAGRAGGSAAGSGNGGSSFAGNAGSGSGGNAGRNAAGSGGSNAAGRGGGAVAGSGGGGGAAGSAGSGATGCAAFCERSLDECENDNVQECFDSCDNSAELCPPESAALIACVLPRPDSDFHCEMGITSANDGVCDAEATALLLCIFQP